MPWTHATMTVMGMANRAIWIDEPTATPKARSWNIGKEMYLS